MYRPYGEQHDLALRLLGLEETPEKAEWTSIIGWSPLAQQTGYLDKEILVNILEFSDENQEGEAVVTRELIGMTDYPGTLVAGRLRSMQARGIIKRAPLSKATTMFLPGVMGDKFPKANDKAWMLTAKSARIARQFDDERFVAK